MNQQQRTDRQQVQQQRQTQGDQIQYQVGPQYYPPPHLYMQPILVPRFHKTMSVDGWTKAVSAWSNSHSHIPETMRLTLIMESLKANEERKGVGRWIVSTVDEGDFNTENQGALEEFIEKFKKKFEVPCWRKCVEIWEQVLAFQKHGDEGPKKYLERWSELEAKIRNSGETISQMFLAVHFIEIAGLQDTTKQSILTMVKLEETRTVLTQIKKAFEIQVANFDKENEANISFWGRSS